MRQRFSLSRAVLVGDRGLLTQPQIDQLKAHPAMAWITALTSVAIRGLLAEAALEVSSPIRGAIDEEGKLSWSRREDAIAEEAKLDGIYVIRTSEPAERLSAADAVRGYKSLAQVKRAFRNLKSLDLLIRHRTEERVPAHIFLCRLAYYTEWHLRGVAPLFEDEELPHHRSRRDPALPARSS